MPDIDKDGLMLGCAPADPTSNVTSGTVEMTAVCGHEVFVAPSSQQLMAEHPGKVNLICITCMGGVTAMHERMASGRARWVRGQEEEVRDALGAEAAEQLKRQFKLGGTTW